MGFLSLRVRRVLLWVAAIVGPMVMAGWAVVALYPDDWRAAEATVRSSHIKSVNISRGNDQWALVVDATYEAAGHRYDASEIVFRNENRDVTEAQTSNWPAGRTFTLYFDADAPDSVSLMPDGGREAVIVMVVLLTPLVVFFTWFVVFMVRRRRLTSKDTP